MVGFFFCILCNLAPIQSFSPFLQNKTNRVLLVEGQSASGVSNVSTLAYYTIIRTLSFFGQGEKRARSVLAAKSRPHVARQAEVRHAAEAKRCFSPFHY